ncbi:hypothetical protein TELCIR_20439, partial [Teladorsagia circumcincta]
ETPPYYYSWIGLGQSETDSYPRWQVVLPDGASRMRCAISSGFGRPSFGGYEGLDPALLKWLILPFASMPNGWSPAATCVAYYNAKSISNSYVYFYPCTSLYNSVCERNMTLMNLY